MPKYTFIHFQLLLLTNIFQEAEIWPQSSTEVTVFFYALEVGEVNCTAYLEVTGREDRIPLR